MAARGLTATKTGTAALSVASNVLLIALKVVAGVITGSVAILAEALQSTIDLVASVIAFVSVRKADQPPDAEHPFGHQKFENLAANFEGVLILVGAGVIVYESARRLTTGGEVEQLGVGIAIIALTVVVNLVVSGVIARRARELRSPALAGDAAHLRTDALTSIGVLVGLALVQLTGETWLDPAIALVVAVAIVITGLRLVAGSSRVLLDEALPAEDIAAIRATIIAFGERGVVGFHALRARRAGARPYVDLHVQFRAGTTLEEAHDLAEELEAAIAERLGGGDVLIHLEPADRVRPGTEVGAADRPSAG
jgi:cation diffusion facilitator family transporter